MIELESWVKGIIGIIDERTHYYTDKEKQIVKLRYLKKLIQDVLPKVEDVVIRESIKKQIDDIVISLPEKNEGTTKIKFRDYLIKLQNLKKVVKDKLDLMEEGQYKALGIVLGLAFGAAVGPIIGVALDNFALGTAIGIPLGMGVGSIIGNSKEAKAKQQNKLI